MLILVSEPKPLRPLRDLQYGLGVTVFGGCRHLEYMNILGFNEPKYSPITKNTTAYSWYIYYITFTTTVFANERKRYTIYDYSTTITFTIINFTVNIFTIIINIYIYIYKYKDI